MYKKLIAAAAMATVSLAGHGQGYTYHFQYTGFSFYHSGAPEAVWRPDARIEGYFIGDDVNLDNVLSRDEISSFYLTRPYDRFGTEFLYGCPAYSAEVVGMAGCTVSAFSYTLGTDQLTYSARALSVYYGSTYNIFEWTENGFTSINTDLPFESNTYVYRTPETIFTITGIVPEPSSWAMLAAGLLIAGAVARRRSRT